MLIDLVRQEYVPYALLVREVYLVCQVTSYYLKERYQRNK